MNETNYPSQSSQKKNNLKTESLIYIFSSKEELKKLKKEMMNNKTGNTVLRPIDHKARPVAFRTIIKCRNGDVRELEKNALASSRASLQKERNSRYSSTGAIDALNEAQSPIKLYVKEHITNKTPDRCSPSLPSQHSKR